MPVCLCFRWRYSALIKKNMADIFFFCFFFLFVCLFFSPFLFFLYKVQQKFLIICFFLCLDKYTTWSELLLPFSHFSHEFFKRDRLEVDWRMIQWPKRENDEMKYRDQSTGNQGRELRFFWQVYKIRLSGGFIVCTIVMMNFYLAAKKRPKRNWSAWQVWQRLDAPMRNEGSEQQSAETFQFRVSNKRRIGSFTDIWPTSANTQNRWQTIRGAAKVIAKIFKRLAPTKQIQSLMRFIKSLGIVN